MLFALAIGIVSTAVFAFALGKARTGDLIVVGAIAAASWIWMVLIIVASRAEDEERAGPSMAARLAFERVDRGDEEGEPPDEGEVDGEGDPPPAGAPVGAGARVRWLEALPTPRHGVIQLAIAAGGDVGVVATGTLANDEPLVFLGQPVPELARGRVALFGLRGLAGVRWARVADGNVGAVGIAVVDGDLVIGTSSTSSFRWTAGAEWPAAFAPSTLGLRIGADPARDRVLRQPPDDSGDVVGAAGDTFFLQSGGEPPRLSAWSGVKARWKVETDPANERLALLDATVVDADVVACLAMRGDALRLGDGPAIPLTGFETERGVVLAWITGDRGQVVTTRSLPGAHPGETCERFTAVRAGAVLGDDHGLRLVRRDGAAAAALPARRELFVALTSDGGDQVAVITEGHDGVLTLLVLDVARNRVRWSYQLPPSIAIRALALRDNVVAIAGERVDALDLGDGTRLPAPAIDDAGFALAIELTDRP